MNIMSFDSSCGACHSKDVGSEKLQQPGMALFSLPTLDIDSLSNNGI